MKIKKILLFTAGVVTSLAFIILLAGLVIIYYDGPELTSYDTGKIREESEKIYLDENIGLGFVNNIPDQYIYLDKIKPISVYKTEHSLSVGVWKFFGRQKGFTLYGSIDSKNKYFSVSQDIEKIDELFYSYYHFD